MKGYSKGYNKGYSKGYGKKTTTSKWVPKIKNEEIEDQMIDDDESVSIIVDKPIGESSSYSTGQGKSLVIVESPGKIKKIRSYLGYNFIVMASVGHIMDLPPKELGINLTNLEPTYVINDDKKKVVSGLKSVLKNVSNIYIASDADREGEFIGYSLVKLLNLKNNYHRITFHEITKTAINKAINQPGLLDENMIKAQQCRRITDRLIGYLVSPILSKNVKGGYGAGRVQSVIVKLILDKQLERERFWQNNDSTFFVCNGSFNINLPKLCNEPFKINAKLYTDNILIKTNKQTMIICFETIKYFNNKGQWNVVNTQVRDVKTYPQAPFITSTLQQASYYRYKFSPDKTMKVAQQLYEKGYITYMRTDSPCLSQEALFQIKNYVETTYGQKYSKLKQYKAKSSSAQEAHECIRPTHIDTLSDNLEDVYDDAKRLYQLIWERTIASQMIECTTSNLDITLELILDKSIRSKKNSVNKILSKLNLPKFIGTVSKITELGFCIIYGENNDHDNSDNEENITNNNVNFNYKVKKTSTDDQNNKLIEMSSMESLNSSQPLYNQPMLIKTLESYGIGRPSTYANLIKKIVDYKYVETSNIVGINKQLVEIKYKPTTDKIVIKEKRSIVGGEKQKLIVTDLGKNVVNFLNKNFPGLMDYKFTSDMENKLDMIAEGKISSDEVLKDFYGLLSSWLTKTKNNIEI
jgi:DNA topoisomerase-1